MGALFRETGRLAIPILGYCGREGFVDGRSGLDCGGAGDREGEDRAGGGGLDGESTAVTKKRRRGDALEKEIFRRPEERYAPGEKLGRSLALPQPRSAWFLAAEWDPGTFCFVRGAGLVGRSVRRTIIGCNQLVREEVCFDFFAADVGKHFAIDFDAGTEHLTALFDHFLALSGIVDDVPVFIRKVILAHDSADTLAPAASGLEVSNDFRLLHILWD